MFTVTTETFMLGFLTILAIIMSIVALVMSSKNECKKDNFGEDNLSSCKKNLNNCENELDSCKIMCPSYVSPSSKSPSSESHSSYAGDQTQWWYKKNETQDQEFGL